MGNAVSGSQLFLDFLDFPKLYLRNDDLHVEGSAALGFCVDLTLVGSTILSDKQSFKFLQSPKKEDKVRIGSVTVKTGNLRSSILCTWSTLISRLVTNKFCFWNFQVRDYLNMYFWISTLFYFMRKKTCIFSHKKSSSLNIRAIKGLFPTFQRSNGH